MKTIKNLNLKTKLVGSFIVIVFLVSLVSYVSIRISLSNVTENALPPVQALAKTTELVKSIQAEVLEFVAVGEEETLEDLVGNIEELDELLKQQETVAPNSGETTLFGNLYQQLKPVPSLGQEIIQSHSQTLERLEALEALENEMETVFDEANVLIEAELAKNIEEQEIDEIVEDSIPTQRFFKQLVDDGRSLQIEALEFVTTGEEETVEEFEEILASLETSLENVDEFLEEDEEGEAALVARLGELQTGLATTGGNIFSSHQKTLAMLEEFEELEEGLEESLAAAQLAVEQDIANSVAEANRNVVISSALMLVLAIALGLVLTSTIVKPIYELVSVSKRIGEGDLTAKAIVTSNDETGELATSFNQMADNLNQRIEAEQRTRAALETANKAQEAQMWQSTGLAELNDKIRGQQDIPTLANNTIQQLCQYLQAQVGAVYIREDANLKLVGGYAYANGDSPKVFKVGEGLVGQAALERQPMLVADVPKDHIPINLGLLGETVPNNIMVSPFMHENQVVGVVEMGTLTEFDQAHLEFLQTVLDTIAITFNTAQARERIDELLAETQRQTEELQAQSEELQAQSEELRVANEELETQTEGLRTSEAKLKEKQGELETTNTQLEEKAAALEESSSALREKQDTLDFQNKELKTAQQTLETKAEELALASKYKSEFLANMSHELRTPLNSLLILARMLVDNEDDNLTEDQVESAQIIYGGGQDLLKLINDILDLSKVESGKMSFNFEPTPLTDLATMAQAQFAHVAEEKGLDLNLTLADDLPASIKTDPQRVKQIIKNLFSNAFKFTTTGSVSLNIYLPDSGLDLSRSGLDPGQAVAVSVADTGIGMTPDQQKTIFEAFQQADGSTNRQYGGTGLGLSISRELASKLGGQLSVESEPEKGSTFTLYLPLETKDHEEERKREGEGNKTNGTGIVEQKPELNQNRKSVQPQFTPTLAAPLSNADTLPDDRDELEAGDKILLVVEDDPKFSKIIYEFSHKKDLKCLIAGNGKTGIQLAKNHNPKAIILDLHLPDISGWDVLEVLKNDPATRHIPVHIMSVEEEVLDAYRKGAMGYLTKPVDLECLNESFKNIEHFIDNDIKTLLLVEDDANARRSVVKLLDGSDVQISEADHGQAALDLLKAQHFDCMILDLSLPDMTGFEVLNRMNGNGKGVGAGCPVIVYTGRDLTPEENQELMKYADSVIVKGVKSPERLLDETALFLHRVVAEMPAEKQQTIKRLYNEDGLLKDKKILIVDDDIRNSFALSKLLADRGISVSIAENGQKALDLLETESVDLVLMDIMMPVMDGYETTQRIRTRPELNGLPILALTAKAMKGDREKCIEAGANDYLPKPIDVDRLFSMLRVWLYQ